MCERRGDMPSLSVCLCPLLCHHTEHLWCPTSKEFQRTHHGWESGGAQSRYRLSLSKPRGGQVADSPGRTSSQREQLAADAESSSDGVRHPLMLKTVTWRRGEREDNPQILFLSVLPYLSVSQMYKVWVERAYQERKSKELS